MIKAVVSIIDDDELVRNCIQNLLQSLGYYVYTFASAEEFLTSRQLDQTSCLIADVRMPGLGGIELQALLRTKGLGSASAAVFESVSFSIVPKFALSQPINC